MCQVSRTPVREALKRLEQDGLVQRTERGLVVRERSPEEILDIYETRIVLEGTAARFAATRRTDLDLLNLRRLNERLKRVDVSVSDEAEMATGNRLFHEAVWRASRNACLIELLTRLHSYLLGHPPTTLTQPNRWETSIEEHARLIEAIEARDQVKASEVATAHFVAARNLRLALWAEEDS
jgi:DNA-binding GntR family transcriptional regulator